MSEAHPHLGYIGKISVSRVYWKEDPAVDIKNAIIAQRRSRIWKPLSIKVIDPESKEYKPRRRLRIFRAMERLPVELRRAVIQHLDIPTIKSLRLTSKAWGALGEEYLVSPLFTALAHRPDIGRLIALSEHPKFSFRIQKLRFNHGEINEYHARHNTYFLQYMRDPDSRMAPPTSAWSAELQEQKSIHLPRQCDPETLNRVFPRLPNLNTIEVSLMTYPFQVENEETSSSLLEDMWHIPSTRLLPRAETKERFTNILTAVSSNLSNISIKTLSHDRLPFEFFAQNAMTISLLSTAFQSLTTLKLAIDYSDMPNNLRYLQAFQNLENCIRSASNLRTLELAFQSRKKIDISPLLANFEEHNYSSTSLEEFTLMGVSCTERDLGNLLTRQKGLKKLQLGGLGVKVSHQPPIGGVHLREGRFIELFARIRDEMSLERFRVQGDLVGLESGERWVLELAEEQERLWEYVMD